MLLAMNADYLLHDFSSWFKHKVIPSPALAYLSFYPLDDYSNLIFPLNAAVRRWRSLSMACLLPSGSVYLAPTCGHVFHLETEDGLVSAPIESISIALTIAACYKLAFNPTTDKEVRDLAIKNYFGLLDDIQSFPDKDLIIALAEAIQKDNLVFNDLTC